jgi:hypothetical protein
MKERKYSQAQHRLLILRRKNNKEEEVKSHQGGRKPLFMVNPERGSRTNFCRRNCPATPIISKCLSLTEQLGNRQERTERIDVHDRQRLKGE